MKKKNIANVDNEDLSPDYDLSKLRLIKRGPGYAKRRSGSIEETVRVTLDPDVANVFDNDKAVNEALRTMIRVIEAAAE